MEKTYNINVDLKKQSGLYDGLVQYDNKLSVLNIRLVDGLRLLNIGEAEEIYCLISRPDGQKIKLDCQLSDDSIRVVLTDGALSVPGLCQCEIKIKNKDCVLTSGDFYLRVRESLVSGKCEGELTNPFLENLVGPPGPPGPPGKDGKDGHTPVVGVDFFREDDQKKLLEEISITRIKEDEIDKLF